MFVPDSYNVADLLTKPCTGTKFDYCAGRLLYGFGMRSAIPTTLEEQVNYATINEIISEENTDNQNEDA